MGASQAAPSNTEGAKAGEPAKMDEVQSMNDILKAIYNDDVEALKKIVPSCFSPNATTEPPPFMHGLCKGSILFFCVARKKKKCAEYLITCGADPNFADPNGRTLIMIACMLQCKRIVRALLAAPSIDVNSIDFKNNCALHYAAKAHKSEILSFLIESNGIQLNIQNIKGRTPIMNAVKVKSTNNFGLLASAGAKLDIADSKGFTPLEIAISMKLSDIVSFYINSTNGPCNTPLSDGVLPIFAVLMKNEARMTEALVSSPKVNVKVLNSNGETPLHFAILQENSAGVHCFLGRDDIDVNEKDDKGCTPLHLSVLLGKKQFAEALMNHPKINPNIKDSKEMTPLEIAMNMGISSITSLILSSPSFIVSPEMSSTPLIKSILYGSNLTAIQQLIGRGFSIDEPNEAGITPVVSALLLNHENVARFFLSTQKIDIKRVYDGGQSIFHILASKKDCYKCLRMVLVYPSAEPNTIDKEGRTPLRVAVDCGNVSNVESLLVSGAVNKNLADRDGMTPFLRAAEVGDIHMILSFLRCKEIDRNAKNSEGLTALHIALANGNEDCAKALAEDFWTDVTISCQKFGTPFELSTAKSFGAVSDMIQMRSKLSVKA